MLHTLVLFNYVALGGFSFVFLPGQFTVMYTYVSRKNIFTAVFLCSFPSLIRIHILLPFPSPLTPLVSLPGWNWPWHQKDLGERRRSTVGFPFVFALPLSGLTLHYLTSFQGRYSKL